MKIIVSKCLLGEACRYDGESRPDARVIALSGCEGYAFLPVCPETEGGLPTPRIPAERVGERVLRRDGVDVTAAYRTGAEKILAKAVAEGVTHAILKAKSPACGAGKIYDGTFSRTLTDGDGVLAELLRRAGICVLTEDEAAAYFAAKDADKTEVKNAAPK